MNKDQYVMLCGRRQAFDNLVWQTPPLATAAQAFLLAASFDPDATRYNAMILAAFSGIVGLASIQLMAKHRYGDVDDAEQLARYEADNADKGYSVLHGKTRTRLAEPNLFVRFSSFRIWIIVLSGFVLLALYAMIAAGR